MSFESELSKGKFCIQQCIKCDKIVWPPSEFCSHCLGKISLKEGDFEGRIIEYSEDDNGYFCMVQFEDTVRIMAKMDHTPKTGQVVKISRCGVKDGSYFFDVI